MPTTNDKTPPVTELDAVPLEQLLERHGLGVAPIWREDLLFRIASSLEEALPWNDRRPPIYGLGAEE